MDAEALSRALNGRWHGHHGLAPCPVPGHGKGLSDRHPSLSISRGERQAILVHCHAGCSAADIFSALRAKGYQFGGSTRSTSPPDQGQPRRHPHTAPIAAALWRQSVPLPGTAAETYLRSRGIGGMAPATLRYLPANGRHAHAMIAAFGRTPECAPGVLQRPNAPPAVHLTRLSADGQARLGKRMIGPVSGHPIVVAPPNDGLGLAITEGIEDALSLHAATGLGAWAAGSATHLAKLGEAVPSLIEVVTIAEDADIAGRTASRKLSACLAARGIACLALRL